ncbi:MAG: DUF2909 domain-containing protein [Burkholderiaceae bacterium]|jgi:TRAP-type C4-dicarboxylate transport system permease large subunit|nr:MAG: DUF2909 domain-containing protein [Burkholderiaceae bacterium]
MKLFIAIVFIGIVVSMGSALFYMMRDDRDSDSENDQRAQRMLISLAVRVGLCIFLFVSILVAWRLGLISPTGIPAGA